MIAILKISTRRFVLAAALVAAAAGVCEILDRVTWQIARPMSHFFDVLGLVLFWLSYTLLAILLIVALFRPRIVFSLHGECGVRAMNFFLALLVFTLLNLSLALAYFFA